MLLYKDASSWPRRARHREILPPIPEASFPLAAPPTPFEAAHVATTTATAEAAIASTEQASFMRRAWHSGKQMAAAALTAVIATTPLVAAESPAPPEPSLIHIGMAAMRLPDATAKECPPVQPEALALVDHLLGNTEPVGEVPRLLQLRNYYLNRAKATIKYGHHIDEDKTVGQAYSQLKHEAAAALGLHVYDANNENLQLDLYPKGRQPITTGDRGRQNIAD